MALRTEIYTDDLIIAIDKWQGGSKNKLDKANLLTKASKHLPSHYRAAPPELYRQVRTNAQLAIGIALDATPVIVSSWSSSLHVARHFREKDQDSSKVLMIFRRRPAEGDVILNLNIVYADPDFLETAREASNRLSRKFKGIELWQGSQNEVVLRETVVGNDEIVSLGAFRSLTDVVPQIGERDPGAPSEAEIFKELTGTAATEHFWTSAASAEEGIRNAAEKIQAYLKNKCLWPDH